MAYQTGTASGYADLLTKLEAFLTTNPDLVASGQNWTTQRYSSGLSAVAFPLSKLSFGTSVGGLITDMAPAALPGNYFKVRVFGTITIPTTGSYTFGIEAAAAAEMVINGSVVVGVYGTNTIGSSYTHTNIVSLDAGTYPFEARLVVSAGVYGMAVGWKKPGDSSVGTIPAASLAGLQYQWASQGTVPTSSAEMAALWTEKELLIKAPGMSGTDPVYIGIQPFSSTAGDYYNWKVNGFTGYASNLEYVNQPGKSTDSYLYLWNSSIPYWFFANGHRVIVVAKVSTTYQIVYAGKLLVYGLPQQYPYPLFIAATSNVASQRWSDGVGLPYASNFSCPGEGANLFYLDSSWQKVRNRYFYSSAITWEPTNIKVWPIVGHNKQAVFNNSLSWPDGTATLIPFILYSISPVNVIGEIDGAYWVTGHQNSSESIISISSDQYVCFQNIFRTGPSDYLALRMA